MDGDLNLPELLAIQKWVNNKIASFAKSTSLVPTEGLVRVGEESPRSVHVPRPSLFGVDAQAPAVMNVCPEVRARGFGRRFLV